MNENLFYWVGQDESEYSMNRLGTAGSAKWSMRDGVTSTLGGIGVSRECPDMRRAPDSSCSQKTCTITPLGYSAHSVPGIHTNLAPTGICKTFTREVTLSLIPGQRKKEKRKLIVFTLTEAPYVKVRVTNLPSAVAASSSACLAIFKKTSSRVASPSWMSTIPYSLSLSWSSVKKFCI